MPRAFAGRHGGVGDPDLGPLSVTWDGPEEPPGTERILCLIDGRVPNAAEIAGPRGAGDDAEAVVAAAYERLGEAVVERLEGEFALLLWDRLTGRGLLARDPLGHRSIYLGRHGRAVVFATEVRPLLRLLPSAPAPDPVAVAHWLARTGAPGGRTLYAGIERLGPGELVRLSADGGGRRRYWSPRYVAPAASPVEPAAALHDQMAAAVRRSVEGVRHPGILLSGGFDSGAIAALACDAGARPHCYSAVFPDLPDVDESESIDAVRAQLGLTGVKCGERGSALAAALEFMLEYDVPSVSPNNFVWAPLAQRAAAETTDVLLDGEGGDELFGCAPQLIADRLRAGRFVAAARLNRRLPGMGDHPPTRLRARGLSLYGLRPALPWRVHTELRRARGRTGPPAWLRPELAAVHRATHDPWAWKRLDGPRWWAAKAFALTAGSEALGAHEQLRRAAALWGTRFAHPFRDVSLVEYVLRLDPALAFDPVHDRPLARAAMAGRLVDDVRLSNRKPFFNEVLATALRTTDAAAVEELLDDPGARLREYVDLNLLRMVPSGTRPARRHVLGLWRAVTLECWLRLQEDREDVSGLRDRAIPGSRTVVD